MGPHIILPLTEPDDPTQHIPGVDTHTHADVHACGLTHLPGAETPVTDCCFRTSLEVLGMAGHRGGRQSIFKKAKHPVFGSVQAHIQLKDKTWSTTYADGAHSVPGVPCLEALVGSDETSRV